MGYPEAERGSRIDPTGDTRVIDDDYFIRGILYIPVHGEAEPFGFGTRVSQKRSHSLPFAYLTRIVSSVGISD